MGYEPMTELRDALRSALYDAFEAGWFDNHGSIADAWEDRAPEVMERPKVRAILALLDSSEPVASLKNMSCPESYVEKYGEDAGGHFMDGVSFAVRALTSPTPTPDPEGGEG